MGGESTDRGGDVGVAKKAQQADAEVAQTGERLGYDAALGAAAVFVIGHVAHVMQALDAPMAAVQGEQPFGVCLLGRQARDQMDLFDAGFSCAAGKDFALDGGDLSDVGKGQVVVQGGARPEAAGLDPAVAFIDRRVLWGEKRPG